MKTYKESGTNTASVQDFDEIHSVAIPMSHQLVHGEKETKSKEVKKHSSILEKLEAEYEAKVKMTLRHEYKAIKKKTEELQTRLIKVQETSSTLQEKLKRLQERIESSGTILRAHSMESKKHNSSYLLSDKKDLERKRAKWQSKSEELKSRLRKLDNESLELKGRIEENNPLLESLFKKEKEIKSAWSKIIEFGKSIITKVKSLLLGHSDKYDLAKKEFQNSKGIEVGNPPSYEETMASDKREAADEREALEALRAWSRSEVEPTSGPIHDNRITYPKLDLGNTFTNKALSGNMEKVESEYIAKNLSLTSFSEVKSGTPVVNALPKVSMGDTKGITSSSTYKAAESTFAPSVTEQELAEPNLSALKAERTKQWVADPVALQSSKVAANLSSIPSLEVKRDTLYIGPETSYVVNALPKVSMDDIESTTFTYVTEESTATSSITEQESNYENIDDDVSSVERDRDTTANILLLYEQAEMEYELENPDAYIRAESTDSEISSISSISLPEKRKQHTETMAMERTEGTTSSPAALLNMEQMFAVHGYMVERCDNVLNNELPNSSMNRIATEHSSSQSQHEALSPEVKSPIFSLP